VQLSKMDREDFDELILNAAKKSLKKGVSKNFTHHLKSQNLGCGDALNFYLTVEDNVILEARFMVAGCMISRASTSLVADFIEGTEVPVVRQACLKALTLLENKDSNEAYCCSDESFSSTFLVIQAVVAIPLRLECALLPWRALSYL
jgi:nitrogen fixation protein NifU and related proteins